MYKIYTKKSGVPEGYAHKIWLIMRLTTVILIATLTQVSAATFAQRITVNVHKTSLESVLKEIHNQSGYDFLFDRKVIINTKPINISVSNVSLEEAINSALIGLPLTYNIDGKIVVIKPREKSVLAGTIGMIRAVLENINVTGKILDAETGKPVPKVTIKLKGTNRMVVGDDLGTFMFYSLPNDAILVISNVGYVTREIKAVEGMVVKLVPATEELKNVVVSSGYQTMNKASTTGSYTVITAKEIEETPSVNLLDRLEGKVPGVHFDIRNNSIQIRGVNDFNTTHAAPLVVIDGFKSQNQNLNNITSGEINGNPMNQLPTTTSGNAILGTLNPADIESITFLKDAAAAAIWGADAANGVIVITTKRGKRGTSNINFSSTFSTSAPANFKNMTTMTNQQYIDFEQELFDKGFFTDPAGDWRNAPVSGAVDWMFKMKNGTVTPAAGQAALNDLANHSNTDQIKDYLLQRATTQQHNLSFSGGGENSSYYVSGNYTKDQPVFKSNSGETYSILSNLTNDFLNKRITLTTGLNYRYSKSQVNGAALSALSVGRDGLAPYQMLVDDSGNKIYSYLDFTKEVSDSLMVTNKSLPWGYNPIDELNYNNTITTNNSIRINASLKGKITNWLNLTVSGEIQKTLQQQVLLENADSYTSRETYNLSYNTLNKVLPPLQPTQPFNTFYGYPAGGTYHDTNSNTDGYNLRSQLDVDKTWGDHHLNMIAGTEISQTTSTGGERLLLGYDEDVSSSKNVNTSNIFYRQIYGNNGKFPTSNGNIFRSAARTLSYYGTATYSYLDKYFATGSIRFDDLNLLGVDRRDRATPLYSGGLRWDVKKENFMDKISWINSLSLRATIGTGGNPPQGSANYSTIVPGQNDSYNQLPYVSISEPANRDIGWETTRQTNLGLDAALFDNRLNVTLETYHKSTYGLLMSLPINGTYGYTRLAYNAGNLAGHGSEIDLTGDIVRTKDWGWTSSFNLSYNTNNVTDTRFPNQVTTGGTSPITTGYPMDNLFVYRWAGLDNTGQSQVYAADGSKISSTSDIAYKPEDFVSAGRTTAPYFGGFTNTARYKNFSLLVRATYYLGNVFLLQTINPTYYPKDGTIFTPGSYQGLLANNAALVNRWKRPGDEAFTNIPGVTGSNLASLDMFDNSDVNVRDAGNIRLQQITLSYSVPKSMLRKTPFIKALNLGVTVSNLGLLWVANKEGIDPDYQMTDAFNNLPPTKNYVFNLSLSL